MKTIALLTLLLATLPACSKSDPASSTTAGGASAASTAASAPKTAAPPKEASAQKGIQPGKVVVGYMQPNGDPSGCIVVTDTPEKKDAYAKDAEKLAQMMKCKVVSSCPTDNLVGTCNPGLGMLANYYGPKWTKESAKKDCVGTPHATWVE